MDSITTGLLKSKTFHTAHRDPKILADGYQNGGDFYLDWTQYPDTVPGSGGVQYLVNGVNRPTLVLTADRTYNFNLENEDFTNYPFYITTSPTGGTGSAGQEFFGEITTSEVSGSGSAPGSSRAQGCAGGASNCTNHVTFTPSSGRIGTVLYYHNGYSGGTGSAAGGPGAGGAIIITGVPATLRADVMTFKLPSGCPEGIGDLEIKASGGNTSVPFSFFNQKVQAIQAIPTSGYYDQTISISGVKLDGVDEILFSGEDGTSEIDVAEYKTVGSTGTVSYTHLTLPTKA